jgi:hypothetical protein
MVQKLLFCFTNINAEIFQHSLGYIFCSERHILVCFCQMLLPSKKHQILIVQKLLCFGAKNVGDIETQGIIFASKVGPNQVPHFELGSWRYKRTTERVLKACRKQTLKAYLPGAWTIKNFFYNFDISVRLPCYERNLRPKQSKLYRPFIACSRLSGTLCFQKCTSLFCNSPVLQA